MTTAQRRKHIVHDSFLIENILPPAFLDDESIFDVLHQELEPLFCEMYHKSGAVPRLVCIQGDIDENGVEPLYRHPVDEQPPLHGWTPTVQKLRAVVVSQCGGDVVRQPFNHVLIQLYRNGDDYISEHCDKTLDIERGTSIVNLSLGASRTMILRPKKNDTPKGTQRDRSQTYRVTMDHGSVFILGWDTNQHMTHEIKRDKRNDIDKSFSELAHNGCRISLTFRNVATFWNPKQGSASLFGQGAPKTFHRSPRHENDKETEEAMMISAFSTENRRSDYDWNDLYGNGFAVVNFKVSNPPTSQT